MNDNTSSADASVELVLAAALRRAAEAHSASRFDEILSRFEDGITTYAARGPLTPTVHLAIDFWAEWIHTHHHGWKRYSAIDRDDWPVLANELADALARGDQISNPMLLLFELEALRREVVDPFYRQLMSVNAVYCPDQLADQAAIVANDIDLADILKLLLSDWRPRVVGAWFAAARTESELGDAVLAALEASRGSLTSPPLVTAALLHQTADTLRVLNAYVERDLANKWGSAGFAASAIERLGGPVRAGVPREGDRQRLAAMLDFAMRLRRT